MGESENAKKIGNVIHKAWTDAEFKKRLLTDTAGALEELGVTVPPNVQIKAVENTDSVYHLVIPPKPTGELAEDQLDRVSGGRCNWLVEGLAHCDILW